MNDDPTRTMSATPPPAPPAPPRRRRRRARRWTIGFLSFLVLIAAGVLALTAYTQARMNDAGDLTNLSSGAGAFLIVGSDSRENLPDDLEGSFGDFAGARADVIIVAQVENGRLQLLSIPRDLKVDIPGNGTNRVNAAYAFGGPDLLVETVSNATGIRIGHYLEVDFAGFASIVDALGGIELDVPYPARDVKSGLEIDAGTQTVDGATALAYARSRSYEEYRDGSWQSAGGGDIARTGRQREVLLQIMNKASSPTGIVRSPGVLAAVTANLTADSSTNPLVLARTALAMRAASNTEAVTLPVRGSSEGGRSYVVADEPDASEVLAAFRAGESLPGA